jgi:hypothetical protein
MATGTLIKIIPKNHWKTSFNRWVENIKYILVKEKNVSRIVCGYCEYYGMGWDWRHKIERCKCPLYPKFCGSDNSTFGKAWQETMKENMDWDIVLSASRETFQAIIDDGRKHGYVGKAEEKKIAEVM